MSPRAAHLLLVACQPIAVMCLRPLPGCSTTLAGRRSQVRRLHRLTVLNHRRPLDPGPEGRSMTE